MARRTLEEVRAEAEARKAEGKKARSSDMVECACDCMCGARTAAAGASNLCYLCSKGYHHVCSNACRAFPGEVGKGWTIPYLPARRPCDGGVFTKPLVRA